MIAVIGTFRFPSEKGGEARTAMQAVIAETLKEDGCHAYSYAQDVNDPGLYRVTEIWTDRVALDRHLAAPHMQEWVAARDALGFHDRNISVFPLGDGEEL
jgi:quinol monooxygenase YgiN